MQTMAVSGDKWIRTIIFSENITVDDSGSKITFDYSEFEKISENDKYYILYINANKALLVEKGTFSVGDETKFCLWIKGMILNK